MKKKVIIGCVISFLVLIIIALAIALIISLNSKKNLNSVYYATGEVSNEYQTIANDFVNAVKSEKQMKEYINKYFDYRACYAYEKLTEKDSIDENDDLQKFVDYYYNTPDESEINKITDSYTGGYLELVNKKYNLTLVNIGAPIKYKGNLKFEDVDATYVDSDGKELVFSFTMYDNKVALIAVPGDDTDGANYSVNFVDADTITYREDYSSFGITSDSMESMLSEEIEDSSYEDGGYILKLKNGTYCYYEVDDIGCVNYIDFYTNWSPSSSSNERKNWEESFNDFLDTYYYDYDSFEDSLKSFISEIDNNLSYDENLPFPQEIYRDSRTNGHSKFEIAVHGMSETELELNFIITPISE